MIKKGLKMCKIVVNTYIRFCSLTKNAHFLFEIKRLIPLNKLKWRTLRISQRFNRIPRT